MMKKIKVSGWFFLLVSAFSQCAFANTIIGEGYTLNFVENNQPYEISDNTITYSNLNVGPSNSNDSNQLSVFF